MPSKSKKRGHGEGTIYQRPDGRWAAQITIGIDPATGKSKRKTYYGKTRKQVQEKLNTGLYDQTVGNVDVDKNKITLKEWANIWLHEYKKMTIKQTSWESYRSVLGSLLLPKLGEVPLQKIRPELLQSLYNSLAQEGKATKTINRLHKIIISLMLQAVKNGILRKTPTDGVELPKVSKKEVRAMSPEEMQRFIAVLDEHEYGLPFLLALATGMRRAEILGLMWDDIDLQKGIIKISRNLVYTKEKGIMFTETKTAKSKRLIPIPQEVRTRLLEHKEEQDTEKDMFGEAYINSGLVFSKVGQPILPRTFNQIFFRLRKKAGIPSDVNLHALRHTYATRLLEEGENLKVVQELLGHSNISMTANTYSHVSVEVKQDAAEKLNKLFQKRLQ